MRRENIADPETLRAALAALEQQAAQIEQKMQELRWIIAHRTRGVGATRPMKTAAPRKKTAGKRLKATRK
ncbi:MAG TPA: hypothetical protein VGH38_27350 [Bryobacteraceae bacterium]